MYNQNALVRNSEAGTSTPCALGCFYLTQVLRALKLNLTKRGYDVDIFKQTGDDTMEEITRRHKLQVAFTTDPRDNYLPQDCEKMTVKQMFAAYDELQRQVGYNVSIFRFVYRNGVRVRMTHDMRKLSEKTIDSVELTEAQS